MMKHKPENTLADHSEDESPPSPSLYEQIGGRGTIERLTEAFYVRVAVDPELRQIFRKNLDVSRDRQTLYLIQALGGPAVYTKSQGCLDLRNLHAGIKISSPEAHAWLDHMSAALNDIGLPQALQDTMMSYFLHEGCKLEDPLNRWWNRSFSDLKTALQMDSSIVTVKGNFGQTLLHHAAGEWDPERVRLLLSHGAETDPQTEGNDSPLHKAAGHMVPVSERSSEDSGAVVDALTTAGADVNARSGSGNQSPLHMAARRGNVKITERLLIAGARIDIQDNKGETPLRRAVNCRQTEVVRLLLSRGADVNRPDRFGQTVIQAARPTKLIDLFDHFLSVAVEAP